MSVAHRAVAELPRRLGLSRSPVLEGLPFALVAGGIIVAFWVVLALGAGLIAPFDPNAQDIAIVLAPPSAQHWLGTDNFGRDVLSRLIYSTRSDLEMGLIGVACPFVLGTILGSIAGYCGGSRALDEALADWAEAYGDQTEADHAALVKAIKTGRIKATTEA